MKGAEYLLSIKIYKTIAAAAAIVLIVWMGAILLRSPLEKEAEVVINDGAGVYKIANILKKEGVIDNEFIFVVYALVIGNEKDLKAGRYIFKPGATIPSVVYSMASGLAESDDIEVTIPEGMNVWEIDKIFLGVGLTREGDFAKVAISIEGKLFPDTYRFERDASVSDIVTRMTGNYLGKVPRITDGQLIIASILEKEAKTENDMRLVAGIINKRMGLGMLLQIDATVAYGACLRNLQPTTYNLQLFKSCDVTQVGVANEIKIDGSYNTYTRAGLPPGPISNPGLKAILAALNPTKSDYLYYLSTRPGRSGDGNQIIFSKTAAEHATNRRKYLGL